MKLEILAECVVRLSECDVDNPADQKTISVCENYILESYKSYLENCELNDLEPLTETEYLQELIVNEGFFKKLLKGAAIVGGAAAAGVAAKKGINAVNQNAAAQGKVAGIQKGGTFAQNVGNTFKTFGNNARLFATQSGGVGGAVRNAAQTSANAAIARQQFAGATRDTNVTSGTQSIALANKQDARQAANNGTNLQGQNTVSYQRKGQETQTVDANSEQGQRIMQGQQKAQENAQNAAQRNADQRAQQSATAKAENKDLRNQFGGNITNKEIEEYKQAEQKDKTKARNQAAQQAGDQAAAQRAQQEKEQRAQANNRTKEEVTNNLQQKYSNMSAEQRQQRLAEAKKRREQIAAKQQELKNQQNQTTPVSEEWSLINEQISLLEMEYQQLEEEIAILENLELNKRSKPLTGAIRCSAKFI